jgi:hypothetical protein
MGTAHTRNQAYKYPSEGYRPEDIQPCPGAHEVASPRTTIIDPKTREKTQEAKEGL